MPPNTISGGRVADADRNQRPADVCAGIASARRDREPMPAPSRRASREKGFGPKFGSDHCESPRELIKIAGKRRLREQQGDWQAGDTQYHPVDLPRFGSERSGTGPTPG
jgi:hypothetical protein